MFKRLTVEQIEKIKPALQVKQIRIRNAFFANWHIFVIEESAPQFLQKLRYNDFQIVESIKIPSVVQEKSIKSLIEIQGLIVFVVQGCNELFFINSERQTQKLTSHLQPINQVIYFALQKQIVTCSDDFTVRIWQCKDGKIIPSKNKHIYAGHQDKVLLLCSFSSHNLFASASKNNDLTFWKNNRLHCTIKLSKMIKSLLYCQKSNQCLIFCQNYEVYGVQLNQIQVDPTNIKLHKVIKHEIEELSAQRFQPKNCSQIDDSFVMLLDNQNLVFLQKNIGQIIKKINLVQKNKEILNMININRMSIFATKKGIYLLKF